MPSKTVIVGSSVGLHARPAAIISEAAGELDSEVTLAVAGEEPVDAASSLLIMTLGAACGDIGRGRRRRPGRRRRDRRARREGPGRLRAAPTSTSRSRSSRRARAASTRRSGRPVSRQVRSVTSGVAPLSRPGGRREEGDEVEQLPVRRGARVLREHAAPVDVRTAEGARGLDAVQAGEVRGAVRDVEVGRTGRRLHPVHDTGDAAVADSSTLAGWKSRCRNVSSYGRSGLGQPRERLLVEPVVARTTAAPPAWTRRPTTRSAAATPPAPDGPRGSPAACRPAPRGAPRPGRRHRAAGSSAGWGRRRSGRRGRRQPACGEPARRSRPAAGARRAPGSSSASACATPRVVDQLAEHRLAAVLDPDQQHPRGDPAAQRRGRDDAPTRGRPRPSDGCRGRGVICRRVR